MSHADFYIAWRVIRRTFPDLLQDPGVAARWAALLSHGALDARAEPVPAAEVLSLLMDRAKVGKTSSTVLAKRGRLSESTLSPSRNRARFKF